MIKAAWARYTLEFKQEAVRLVESGQSIAAASRTLGLVEQTFSNSSPYRSFATMHAAVYDAVNNIDRTHRPYFVRLAGVSRRDAASAAADAAAHAVLIALYPDFEKTLDVQVNQLLSQIPDGVHKIRESKLAKWLLMPSSMLEAVTDRLLNLRHLSLGVRRAAFNPHPRISRNRSSPNGPESHHLLWKPQTSFVPDRRRN